MTFSTVFNPVLTMLIPFFVGMIYYKTIKPSDDFPKELSAYLFNISFPATTFASIMYANINDFNSTFLICMIFGFAFYLFSYIIGLILGKVITKDKEKNAIVVFSTVFPNFVFMAYPIITMIFGVEKLVYATAFNLVAMIFVPTIGVRIIQDVSKNSSDIKAKGLDFIYKYLNPPTVALILAFVVKFSGIILYAPILKSVNMLSDTTSVMSMFMGGVLLIQSGIIKPLKSFDIYIVSFIRLLVLPLICGISGKLTNLPSDIVLVITIIIAMPVASNCLMYARNFDVKPEYATGIVFVSGLLSLVTCPLVFMLVKFILN
jgi:predicted permease